LLTAPFSIDRAPGLALREPQRNAPRAAPERTLPASPLLRGDASRCVSEGFAKRGTANAAEECRGIVITTTSSIE